MKIAKRDLLHWIAAATACAVSAVLLARTYARRQDIQEWRRNVSAAFEGRSLAQSRLLDRGEPITLASRSQGQRTIIYVFRKDCSVCEAQRQEIAALLSSAATTGVLTVSPEADSAVSGYWNASALEGASVLRLPPSTMQEMGVSLVPSILLVNDDNTVARLIPGRADAAVRSEVRRFASGAK